MKVALLIPCTSNNHDDWRTAKDTYLYKLTLMTFLYTYDKEHEYTVYIGYDPDDRIFSTDACHAEIARFSKVWSNVSFRFIQFDDIRKGHLTKMWNVLFRRAYDEACDYFYQCGDDISFRTSGWINDSINTLKSHNDFGISGPLNNNNQIMTQAMFSRKHMEIFGWLFPEEIMNWCCDDWYNHLYRPSLYYPLIKHYCSNEGGEPRYVINCDESFNDNHMGLRNTQLLRESARNLAMKHQAVLISYMNARNARNLRFPATLPST